MVTIHINTKPTLIIFRSIFEPEYPLEALGYLYGERRNHNGYINYFVENAQSVGCTKIRSHEKVVDTDRSLKALKIGSSLENIIGKYHTHTDTNIPGLSNHDDPDDDFQEMLKNPYRTSLLITVNITNKKQPLKIYKTEIIGTKRFDGEYYLLHIKGYYLYGKSIRVADLKFKKSVLKELFE